TPRTHVQISIADPPRGVRGQGMRGTPRNDLPDALISGVDEVDDLAALIESPRGSPVFVDGGAGVEAGRNDPFAVPRTRQRGADGDGASLLCGDLRRIEDLISAEGGIEDRSSTGSHLSGVERRRPGSIRCRDDILRKFLHAPRVSSVADIGPELAA